MLILFVFFQNSVSSFENSTDPDHQKLADQDLQHINSLPTSVIC